MTPRRPHLNLATRPLRNRGFFLTAAGALLIVAVGLGFLAVGTFVRARVTAGADRAAIAQMRREVTKAGQERTRDNTETSQLRKRLETRVEEVNAMLLRKSLSWVKVLNELEAALPAESYITALAPVFEAGGTVRMKVRVISTDLDGLLAFVRNLAARSFRDIRAENETSAEEGGVSSDITARYERLP